MEVSKWGEEVEVFTWRIRGVGEEVSRWITCGGEGVLMSRLSSVWFRCRGGAEEVEVYRCRGWLR